MYRGYVWRNVASWCSSGLLPQFLSGLTICSATWRSRWCWCKFAGQGLGAVPNGFPAENETHESFNADTSMHTKVYSGESSDTMKSDAMSCHLQTRCQRPCLVVQFVHQVSSSTVLVWGLMKVLPRDHISCLLMQFEWRVHISVRTFGCQEVRQVWLHKIWRRTCVLEGIPAGHLSWSSRPTRISDGFELVERGSDRLIAWRSILLKLRLFTLNL